MTSFVSELSGVMTQLQSVLLQTPNVNFSEVPDDLRQTKTFLEHLVATYTSFATHQQKHTEMAIQVVSVIYT